MSNVALDIQDGQGWHDAKNVLPEGVEHYGLTRRVLVWIVTPRSHDGDRAAEFHDIDRWNVAQARWDIPSMGFRETTHWRELPPGPQP